MFSVAFNGREGKSRLHSYCGAWDSRRPELTPGQAAVLPTGGFEAVDVNVPWLVILTFLLNDSAVVENETKKLLNLEQKKAPNKQSPLLSLLSKGCGGTGVTHNCAFKVPGGYTQL